MKIILLWTTGDERNQVLFDALQREGHEIVYWVGDHASAHMTPGGAIFHDNNDAWDAKRPAALADMVIPPPSAELIGRMYRTESIALSMMNKHFDDAPVDERKYIYYSMLGYWNFVLDLVKPDAVIFGIVPHTTYNFILHELARERGIKTISFEDVWGVYRTLAYQDFWKGSEELRAAIQRNSNLPVTENDLSGTVRAYWIEMAGRSELPYVADMRKKGKGLPLFVRRVRVTASSFLSGNGWKLVWSFLRRVFKNNLQSEYARCVSWVDLNVPYVYFPLQYQPERSTSPQGDAYHNQILAIETVAAALPEGWQLYVKEHPTQWVLRTGVQYSCSRYRGYYEHITAVPRVRLLPMDTGTFKLIDHSKTVAVVSGTAGLEALFCGKRPLIFGLPWWRDCPGVLRVDSVESCREALRKIDEGGSKRNALVFLKALDEVGVPSYIDPNFYGKSPCITPQENIENLAEYACKFLKKF